MKRAYLREFYLLFFFILSYTGFSQGEANNWYFGNGAGLNFNTNPPTVLTDGQLFTTEGCSSISAPNGDLLFYTDGRNIWDANNLLMPNANYLAGTGLNGDPSSTSSGLIVPHPTQDNLFFVFTVDEPHHDNGFAYPNQGPANPDGSPRSEYSDTGDVIPDGDDGFNNGFNYSIVDMNLNGGFGDVIPIQKNIELLTYDPNNPEDLKYKCGEKITAVRGEDCESVWVITHFKDTFYSFKIDENGIDETPVTSQVGPLVSSDDYRRAAIGYLKASPEGDKLICANQTLDYNPITNNDLGTGNVFLFDFDNDTGIVTNPLELISNVNAYGVEFSAGGTKAYATVLNNNILQLIQWDLDAADVPGSSFVFAGTSGSTGAIQLAPNGKIYRTIFGQNRLAAINNPELQGAAAGYTENIAQGAVSLGPNTGTLGLPPFIQSLFSTRVDITGLDILELDLCDGEEFTLFYEDLPGATFEWRKDGDILGNETSSTLLISQPLGVQLPFSESYTLTVDLNDGSCPILGAVNVTYNALPVFNDAFLNECTLDFEQSSSVFDLSEAVTQIIPDGEISADYAFTYYETSEDASAGVNAITDVNAYTNISTPQEIVVVGEELASGCTNTTTLTLNIIDFQFIEGFELALCDDNQNGIRDFDLTAIEIQESIQVDAFYLTENEALNEINPITNPTNFTIQNPFQQELFFRIENNTPCEDLGVLSLSVIELPEVINEIAYYCVEDFPNPIQINSGLDINSTTNFEYLWITSNATTETIAVNEAGLYEVAITNIETGCTNFRVVEVIESGLSDYELDIKEFENDTNIVTVVVSEASLGDYEYALDANGPYKDSNVFENLLPGIYDAFVRDKNGCGVVQKRFGILGIMEYFTPNGDGINDVWGFKGNFNNKQPFASVYIFDRYGKLIKSFTGLEKSWDGTYNNTAMPSQDYWYKIELPTGRVLTGNFTLKR